jgi:hypothetical protein
VATYFPIDIGPDANRVNGCDVMVHWEVNRLTADFPFYDDETRAIRITFDKQTIVRIVDEMPISTEDDPATRKGLVPDHFAYRVEGGEFAATQSQAWKTVEGPVCHYEFLTGWGCLDVLSAAEPTFEVVTI